MTASSVLAGQKRCVLMRKLAIRCAVTAPATSVKYMAKKRIFTVLGGLVFLSGLMAFFGIPGIIPIVMDWTKPKLDDVVFCVPHNVERCSDVLLEGIPSGKIITANRLTVGADLKLPAGMTIIANEIDLGGRTLETDDRLIILAREVRNGTVRVSSSPTSRDRNEKDGVDGRSGGTLIAALGSIASTLRFNLSGVDGANGSAGVPGSDGRDGKCGGFGGYRGAHAGGNGTDGGSGGHGGDGGSLNLWFAVGPITSGQINVTEGRSGAGGSGGRQGRGGAGCTGLGGSQENEKDGLPGAVGLDGKAGGAGVSNVIGPDLPAIIRLSKRIVEKPPSDFEDARRMISAELGGRG